MSKRVGRWRAGWLLLLALATPAAPAAVTRLVLLHINDTHGNLTATRGRGGFARLAAKVRQVRAENPDHTLFCHAGDIISRGDPLTMWSGGEANLRILNLLGCDAWTPGNGDFYTGVDHLQRLRGLIGFPVLHGNGVPRAGRPFETTLIKTVAGVKIGLFGVGRINTDHPSCREVEIKDAVQVAGAAARALRPQVDLLVGLTHIGYENDRKLAAQNPEIDVILGGDSHTQLNEAKHVPRPDGHGETLIAQSGDRCRLLGRVDVEVSRDGAAATVAKLDGHLEPLDEKVPEDPEVVAWLAREQAALEQPLFRCETAIDNPKTGRSPMGELVAEAIRAAANAPVGLMWREDVRAGLAAGVGSLVDVVRVHPYHGPLLVAELTGAQILAALVEGKQCAAGCAWREADGQVTDLQVGGRPIGATDKLAVAVSTFGFYNTPAWQGATVRPVSRTVDQALAEYLKRTRPVAP